jgi:hypothetical protein
LGSDRGFQAAALSAYSGAEDPYVRKLLPDGFQSRGIGGADNQPDIGRPAADLSGDLEIQGTDLMAASAAGIFSVYLQSLEVSGFGVRGAAEKEQTFPFVLEKRANRFPPQKRIQCRGIHTVVVEKCLSIGRGGLPDIVSLCIEYHRRVFRDQLEGFPQRTEPVQAITLVKGDVWFVAGRIG